MSPLGVFVAGLILLVGVASAQDEAKPTYTTKYDTLDLDEILKSERLLSNYFKCLMETGPCTPDGLELRKTIPDALVNKCAACTEKQQAGSDRVIRFLIENHPKEFTQLEKKYDPTGIFRKDYQAEAEKRGIKLPDPPAQ